jgi:glycosyltransferase involved in cell wall biosynthesis
VSEPGISVVVPVRDERENLEPLWGELKSALEGVGRDFEVLFVDDGSLDGSREVLERLTVSDGRIRVLRLESPSGQTAALDAGFRAARGELVITLDADLQNDPADIPLLLERLGPLDALSGYRLRRHDSWLRRVSSRLANGVRNRVTGDHVLDTGCSLKIFRRRCLQRIRLYDGMHRFLPTLLRLEGFSVGQIPVRHRPRVWGSSKYGVRGRFLRGCADLLAVRWMIRRRLGYRLAEGERIREKGRNSRAV